MKNAEHPKPGSRWRHYEGDEYIVVGVARNANAGVQCEGDNKASGVADIWQVVYHRVWAEGNPFVRSVREWYDEVEAPDSEPGRRVWVPRFSPVGDAKPNHAPINAGHGHVFLRPDGVKMRCGGVGGSCAECNRDFALAAMDQDGRPLTDWAKERLGLVKR